MTALIIDGKQIAQQLRAGWITPVPGGVGPMTIAMLLCNTILSAERRAKAQGIRLDAEPRALRSIAGSCAGARGWLRLL